MSDGFRNSARYINNAGFNNNWLPVTHSQQQPQVNGGVYWSNGLATLYQADARQIPLPDKSVHMVVTSPPYFGLRDYQLGDGGIGLEPTLGEWAANIVAVMREVRRVLRDDGTLWLNLGDAYAGSGKGMNADGSHSDGEKQATNAGSLNPGKRTPRGAGSGRWGMGDMPVNGLPAKSLMGQPWRVAFALVDDGWILRKDIIWAKPNPMPESVTDRPTTAHEYLFLFSKQGRYFYDADAVKERLSGGANAGRKDGKHRPGKPHDENDHRPDSWQNTYTPSTRNARSVWSIPTQGYAGAHFATFPEELPKRCILAGTSEHGVCAECGAPWRREVNKSASPHDAQIDSAYAKGSAANRLALARQAARSRGNECQQTTQTLGWQPTCECNAERCPYHKAYDAYTAAYDEWELERDGFDNGWHDRPHPGPAPEPPIEDCSCGNADRVPATVLDPFAGSGTTLAVAQQLGRRSIGLDLNLEYLKLAAERIGKIPMPLAAPVESNHDLQDMPQHPPLFSLRAGDGGDGPCAGADAA